MRGLWALCFVLGVCSLGAYAQEDAQDDDAPAEVAEDGEDPVYDPSSSASEPFEEEPTEEEPNTEDENGEEDGEEAESAFVDEHISKEQMKGLHGLMDGNKDGKLSMVEIMDFSKVVSVGIAAKNIGDTFTEADEDQDGKVTLEELIAHKFGHPIPAEDDTAEKTQDEIDGEATLVKEKELEKDTFKVADKDGNGFLNKEEFTLVFYPEHHEPVLHVTSAFAFARKDKDGNGHLTSHELFEVEGDEVQDKDVEAANKVDFDKLDADKDGKVSVEEHKKWESGEFHLEDDMHQLFEIADENKDQHITPGELESAREVLANSMASNRFVDWVQHHEL